MSSDFSVEPVTGLDTAVSANDEPINGPDVSRSLLARLLAAVVTNESVLLGTKIDVEVLDESNEPIVDVDAYDDKRKEPMSEVNTTDGDCNEPIAEVVKTDEKEVSLLATSDREVAKDNVVGVSEGDADLPVTASPLLISGPLCKADDTSAVAPSDNGFTVSELVLDTSWLCDDEAIAAELYKECILLTEFNANAPDCCDDEFGNTDNML